MDELIRNFITTGFADFEGLRIAGAIPIKQEIINEAIAALLQESQSAAAGGVTPSPSPGKASSPIPPAVLLRMVQHAEVKVTAGKITLEFEIRR